jgi:hypothetical protein
MACRCSTTSCDAESPQHFCAFDLLWFDGRDLHGLPLIERKTMLRTLVPPQPSPLLYVGHVAGTGTALFQAVCERDMEGIVARLAGGAYTPDETTWVKIKNPAYSQAKGRAEFFRGPGASARAARANPYIPITALSCRYHQRQVSPGLGGGGGRPAIHRGGSATPARSLW